MTSIFRFVVCGLLSLLLASAAHAQIPRTISFQGVLADASGILVPDGLHAITANVYDRATGGTALFSERQQVQVTRGVFSMLIGGSTPGGVPALIAFDAPYFLGVQVDDAVELTPRTPFASVPYALNAAHAVFAVHADTAAIALLADSARSAATAAHALVADDVTGGYVASLGGAQGNLELLGAGATSIIRSGNQIVIRSTDTSGGGIRRLDNFDGSLVIDPPQGPYSSVFVREQGIQTFHYRDRSIINEKIANNAVDARTISTGGAGPRTALMSVGVATPMWLNPIHVNLAYHDVLPSDSVLWSLTNSGTGGAGSYAVTSPSSQAIALAATTAGGGPALRATTTGTGSGASIQTTNPRAVAPTLVVSQAGTGSAGTFEQSNTTSMTGALSATTYGGGPAGLFLSASAASQTGAVTAIATGPTSSGGMFANIARGTALQALGTYDAALPTFYAARRQSFVSTTPDNNVLRSAVIDAFNQWPAGVGVSGRAQDGIGISGYTETGEAAVKGWSNGTGLAGLFIGGVQMRSGTVTMDTLRVGVLNCTVSLSKPAGTFKIDHPLDPANKFLYHSFVESPEMLNVYSGVTTLDEHGSATVVLPDWFDALNRDVRYQLTPIGAPAPGLYIAREVTDNRFTIAGGTPGLRVSWMLTGVRHDPYADDHRVQVEVDKSPTERGTFIYPEGYTAPRPDALDVH